MRLIVQAVHSAEVKVYADATSTIVKQDSIWNGILIYLGIGKEDENREDWQDAIRKFTTKLTTLKLLNSPNGKIESTLMEKGNQILLISNFTLFGRYKNGTKMDFSQSGSFNFAKEVYLFFIQCLEDASFEVKSGEFWADMMVSSCTIWPINYYFTL